MREAFAYYDPDADISSLGGSFPWVRAKPRGGS